MRIKWTAGAIRQLHVIHAFYAEVAPDSAAKLFVRIQTSTIQLSKFPESGRLSADGRFREVIVPGCDFIVAYRIQVNAVEIIRVYHGKRMMPPLAH